MQEKSGRSPVKLKIRTPQGEQVLLRRIAHLEAVNAQLLEALKWMVENDDTYEGEEPVESLGGLSWNEYNAFWIEGLNKARAAIKNAEEMTYELV